MSIQPQIVDEAHDNRVFQNWYPEGFFQMQEPEIVNSRVATSATLKLFDGDSAVWFPTRVEVLY